MKWFWSYTIAYTKIGKSTRPSAAQHDVLLCKGGEDVAHGRLRFRIGESTVVGTQHEVVRNALFAGFHLVAHIDVKDGQCLEQAAALLADDGLDVGTGGVDVAHEREVAGGGGMTGQRTEHRGAAAVRKEHVHIDLGGGNTRFDAVVAEHGGMHFAEDHFLPEIIDPASGRVLGEGDSGELVVTSLTKQAFPLLRYRTRDICVLSRKKCSCGRTLIKMSKPMGRSDDMLIVKGVNVFPSQIETVLLEQGYPANYQIIVDRVNHSDKLEVLVEMAPDKFSDSLADIAEQEKVLVEELKKMLGIYARVKIVSPKTIARSEGKAVRVIDKRKI